jgi:hypothetical protein
MNPNYSRIAARAGHRCEYCHAPEAIMNFPFEVEHIVPRSEDGAISAENLALSCRSCNVYKSAALTGIDPATNRAVHLFHPRTDCWSEHFELDYETGMMIGKSDVGRATIARLRMNNVQPVSSRRLWIPLGLI